MTSPSVCPAVPSCCKCSLLVLRDACSCSGDSPALLIFVVVLPGNAETNFSPATAYWQHKACLMRAFIQQTILYAVPCHDHQPSAWQQALFVNITVMALRRYGNRYAERRAIFISANRSRIGHRYDHDIWQPVFVAQFLYLCLVNSEPCWLIGASDISVWRGDIELDSCRITTLAVSRIKAFSWWCYCCFR